MNMSKPLVVGILVVAIGAAIAGFVGEGKVQQSEGSAKVLPPFLHGFPTNLISSRSELQSLERAEEWLNSPPLTAEMLRGKVVLVTFWTYTCINWLRTHAYVRAWADKYRDQGLVVIGVHSPEFSFEKNVSNVRWAVKDMRIGYPVAVDSKHAIWRAFRNNYWPAFYFIDAQGRIRHHQFGEGAYAQSEMVIRRLLMEAGATGDSGDMVSISGSGLEAEADWRNLKSPETYLGYERAYSFASPGSAERDKDRVYGFPARLGLQ